MEMDDGTFLDYCDLHAFSARCGFTPAQIARLYDLSGDVILAGAWGRQANRVVDCDKNEIWYLVVEARRRLKIGDHLLTAGEPQRTSDGPLAVAS